MLQMKASNPTNTMNTITGTQRNSAGQIPITIENQDQFLHLHNSYLLKADNARYADADLTNPGLLHLFSSLKLTLAEQTVEHVNYPCPSRFCELFNNICKWMWTDTRLVPRYKH